MAATLRPAVENRQPFQLFTIFGNQGPRTLTSLGLARVQFNRDGTGELRFLLVQGGMDCRFEARDGKPFVEFSCLGFDEMEETCGRGWAELEADSRLRGRLFFHLLIEAGFQHRIRVAVECDFAPVPFDRGRAISVIGLIQIWFEWNSQHARSKLGWAPRVCQQPGVNARLGAYIEIPEVVADTVEDMNLKLPPTNVNIADIRRKYHAAARPKGARSKTAENIQ